MDEAVLWWSVTPRAGEKWKINEILAIEVASLLLWAQEDHSRRTSPLGTQWDGGQGGAQTTIYRDSGNSGGSVYSYKPHAGLPRVFSPNGPKGRPFFLIYNWQPGRSHPKVTSGQFQLIKALPGAPRTDWHLWLSRTQPSFSRSSSSYPFSSSDHFLDFSPSSSGFCCNSCIGHMFFFFFSLSLLAETIILLLWDLFSMERFKNEKPCFRRVSIKSALFFSIGKKRKRKWAHSEGWVSALRVAQRLDAQVRPLSLTGHLHPGLLRGGRKAAARAHLF